MKIRKSLKSNKSPKSCFTIKVKYTHGDADFYTYEDYTLKTESDEDFILYVKMFNKIASAIEDDDLCSVVQPEHMTEMSTYKIPVPGTTLYIHTLLDCTALDYTEYTARMQMDLNEIYFYDTNGVAYDVFVE